MSKLEFKAEQFKKPIGDHEYDFWMNKDHLGKDRFEFMAEIAQAIYDKYLEGLPKVECDQTISNIECHTIWPHLGPPTHTARLDAMEKLK